MSFPVLELLYSFTVALFLTTALIPLCIRIAPQLGLIDLPNESRKVHSRAIPRSGGLAMVLGIALPLLWFLPADRELLHLCIGGSIIIVFGLLDDSRNLDYKWKFLGQIIATLIVMRGGFILEHLPLVWHDLPTWLTYPLTFFFILGVVNAVNLTDGLDGLAAGTTLLALAVLLVLSLQTEQQSAAFIALTVIGGILGFLRYNTHPAQVFMGDTGSQSLGFLAACLSIWVTQSPLCAVSTALPLLILGLPVLDTLTVMTIRVMEGRSPFSPDRNHIHHKIMALGFRHNEAVGIIYLLQILLLALAFSLRFESDRLLLAVYVLFCIALIGTLHFARRCGWRLRPSETQQQSWLDRRNIFLRRLTWFYQHSAHFVQGLLAVLLLIPALVPTTHLSSLTLILLPLLAVALLIFKRLPAWSTRLCIYPASVLGVYVTSSNDGIDDYLWLLNAGYIILAISLALAIRMTRREHFRLDTQDLLVLILILAVPLMPFDSLSHYAIGEITLRLAVLMYSCEFIISKTSGRSLLPVNIVAVVSLLLMTMLHTLLSL